jgi:aspartate/methionine/tyrosine aminotransferase
MLTERQELLLKSHREIDLLARTSPRPFISGWETTHTIRYEHLAPLQDNSLAADRPFDYSFMADDESLDEKVREFHRHVDGGFPGEAAVFVGAGSSPLLTSLQMFLADSGEKELLYVPPVYHAYYQMAKILGLRMTPLGDGLTRDGEARVLEQLPGRRATLLITDPSWISGRSASAEFHRGLAGWQRATGSRVFVDGTFQYTKWAGMAAERSAALVPSQTFRLVCPTKSLCVHGVRCAYLILPAADVEDIGWLYCKLVAATSVFDIMAAHLMLDQLLSPANNRDLVAAVRRNYAELSERKLVLAPVAEPDCTYYVFGKPGFDDTAILSMNGNHFELPHLGDRIRINLLSPHLPALLEAGRNRCALCNSPLMHEPADNRRTGVAGVPRVQVQHIAEAAARLAQRAGDSEWHPGAAPGTLLRSVGELCELSRDETADRAVIPDLLARVVIAAACVAVKYRTPLHQALPEGAADPGWMPAAAPGRMPAGEPGRMPAGEPGRTGSAPIAALAGQLRHGAESIVRTVGYYEGDPPGGDAEVEALRTLLPRFLRTALAGFGSAEELRQSLQRQFRAARVTDTGGPAAAEAPGDVTAARGPRFDPSAAGALSLFRPVTQQTFCPFASKSRLWGAPDYDVAKPFEENMLASLPPLRALVRALPTDTLDGYVYAFPVGTFGNCVADLARLFRALVCFLLEHTDDSTPPRLDETAVLHPQWRLFIQGEQFFISVFAPFYRPDHSRYTFESRDWIFMMLQPEAAIHQYIPEELFDARCEGIRERFAESFQSYDIAELEADRFVLPAGPGQPPVRWYDAGYAAPLQPPAGNVSYYEFGLFRVLPLQGAARQAQAP